MKLYLSSVFAASILASLMAYVPHSPGIHSTPGFWLMLANLPGTVVGVWFGILFDPNNGHDISLYLLVAATNCVAYISVAKVILLVKGKCFK
jgi:small basic protein